MTVNEYNKSVELFSDNIFRFGLKNVMDVNSAKDIVQETFIRLWNKVDDVSFEKVKSYLFTTAYHIIIDMHRKEKRMVGFENVHENSYNHSTGYSDLKEILNRALKILPEIQRMVVLLRDYEGYSYKEIGEIAKLNEAQVKVYIYRARNTLKSYLEKIGVTA